MPKRITKQQIKLISELRTEGKSIAETAALVGLSTSSVMRHQPAHARRGPVVRRSIKTSYVAPVTTTDKKVLFDLVLDAKLDAASKIQILKVLNA